MWCAGAVCACAGAPPAAVAPAAIDPCVVAEGPLTPDTLTFALPGAVDPAHAPIPVSASERVVFRAVYETLIRVDCRGMVRPGLAARWRSEDGGRRWVFELRDGAAFADGLPVTADAVAAGWLAGSARIRHPWSAAGSVEVRDERTLAVTLERSYRDVPRMFADPALAIARPAPDGTSWPLGSGAYAIAGVRGGRLSAAPAAGTPRDALPVLSFVTGGADPRDLVDAGVDLLLTRERAVAAYASAAGASRAIALPWDLVYVLIVPAGSADTARFETVALHDDLTAASAGSEARPAESPFWWDAAEDCAPPGAGSGPLASAPRTPRLIYPGDDPTARGLAERLVALAASGRLPVPISPGAGAPRVVAAGLDRAEYEAALADGTAAGYVQALERQVLDRCAAAESLARSVPWRARLVPLIETRAVLVVRRAAGAVAIEWDGTPVLQTVGPRP